MALGPTCDMRFVLSVRRNPISSHFLHDLFSFQFWFNKGNVLIEGWQDNMGINGGMRWMVSRGIVVVRCRLCYPSSPTGSAIN